MCVPSAPGRAAASRNTHLGDDHVISRHLPCYYSFSSEAFLICLIASFDYLIDFWIKPALGEFSFLIPGH